MSFFYLTEAQLVGLKNYKYNAIDSSPVSKYICHPFWNKIVNLVPKWIAPNLLTFVGFMFCVSNYLLLSWFDYEFYASSNDNASYLPVPSVVWLLCSLFQLLSHSLDGIDGKQARRTGTSGPLGELFDHGLDSWTTLFLSNAVISVFGREDYSISIQRIYFLILAVHIGFFLSHFEKYNTGVLYLPWSYDISQIGIAGIYFVTFLSGYEVWKTYYPLSLNSGNCFEIAIYTGGFILSLPITIYNIYTSYQDKSGRMHSPLEMLRPLVSTVALIILCITWMSLSENDVISNLPRVFFFMTGTIFSNIMCRLIVSQMSNTRCELFNLFLLPLFAFNAVLLAFSVPANIEYGFLIVFTVLVTLSHLYYGACVVYQMSKYFEVPIFSVKKKTSDD